MAAPKAGGMRFRGRPSGGAETPQGRLSCPPYVSGIGGHGRRSRIPLVAVAQPAFASRCLRENAGLRGWQGLQVEEFSKLRNCATRKISL